jgi:delta1-piperideine-2-carboxylate reductase
MQWIEEAELVGLVTEILKRSGCSLHVADIIASNCVAAERDGSVSHGLFRMEGYVSSLRCGWVDGRAVPRVVASAPSVVIVDAGNGFAQPALAAARKDFLRRTQENGIALLAIRNSHHLAALWPDVEPFAEDGFVALTMVNSLCCSVPYGAHRPVFGTNPIAFAAPSANGPPIVVDMATTTFAHGDVQVARDQGHKLPPGSGLDRDGVPTDDPEAILDGGHLVPFGGHKGSAISLMVELLCAGLSGGNFSFEFDLKNHPGAHTPHTGQIIIAIDPARGGSRAPFAERAATLLGRLSDAGLDSRPGRRRHELRAQRRQTGIPVPVEAVERLQRHVRELA